MFSERRQMTGQANVNATKLKALPIALPPLDQQRQITARLGALRGALGALGAMQQETAAELEAMLPAVLERAFRGEL